jgi:hypothetical protein
VTDLFGPVVATQPPDGEAGRARGAYYTNDALALSLVRTLRATLGVPAKTILEPGCGGGAFLRAAEKAWPFAALHGVDLVPACTGPGFIQTRDLFTVQTGYDLVLGNPDFSIADRVVRHCMGLLTKDGHLALLLRLSFLESIERVPLFTDFPLYAFQPIAQRQSFTGDGQGDKVGLGLYVWKQGHRGPGRILSPLVWR